MSIALVVTAGFGNGTLEGSISDVVTRGYAIGIIPGPTYGLSGGVSGASKGVGRGARGKKVTGMSLVGTIGNTGTKGIIGN